MLQPIAELAPNMDISVIIYSIITNVFILGQEFVFFLGIDPESGKFFFTENFLEYKSSGASFIADFTGLGHFISHDFLSSRAMACKEKYSVFTGDFLADTFMAPAFLQQWLLP